MTLTGSKCFVSMGVMVIFEETCWVSCNICYSPVVNLDTQEYLTFRKTHTKLSLEPINDQCSPSHRNQSIDLQSKSIDWFPYDGERNGLTHFILLVSFYAPWNQICSDVFRGYRKRPMTWKGLMVYASLILLGYYHSFVLELVASCTFKLLGNIFIANSRLNWKVIPKKETLWISLLPRIGRKCGIEKRNVAYT